MPCWALGENNTLALVFRVSLRTRMVIKSCPEHGHECYGTKP